VKIIPVALAPQYAAPAATLAACLKITRRDGQVFGFTETDHEIEVDAVTYVPGFDMSELSTQSGLGVDNMQVTFMPESPGDDVVGVELLAGLWNYAAFEVFEVNYKAPADGVNLLRRGFTGEASLQRDGYVLEFRSMKQALQQSLGSVTSKTCRWRLGSTARPAGLCMIDLDAGWTNVEATTAVASRREFTTASAEADDFYKEGIARGVDGLNAGYEQKIKAFASGVVTLSLPMPFDIDVGDEFTLIAGCQKRLDEDCKTKFDNVLNFGGEPHVPGPDLLTGDPEASG
jgi:uncharacterized phage protein (TIGR02218 family)